MNIAEATTPQAGAATRPDQVRPSFRFFATPSSASPLPLLFRGPAAPGTPPGDTAQRLPRSSSIPGDSHTIGKPRALLPAPCPYTPSGVGPKETGVPYPRSTGTCRPSAIISLRRLAGGGLPAPRRKCDLSAAPRGRGLGPGGRALGGNLRLSISLASILVPWLHWAHVSH